MSGNIQTLYTTLAGVKQDFKIDWKEDAKKDWKTDWAVTAPPAPPTPVPVNSVAPVISGSLTHPAMLSATAGTWTNSPTSYTYQWFNSYSGAIGGATAATYTTGAGDVGYNITCHVVAVNAGGNSVAAVSNSLGPIL